MDSVFIVSNLKSKQTENEAKKWLEEFEKLLKLDKIKGKEIIICPSYTFLQIYRDFIKQTLPMIKVGAQNVSPFDEGPYTGEENAKQVKEYADYVLIGHSERRLNFNEGLSMLTNKVAISIAHNLEPIFIVQNQAEVIPSGVKIVAYEPLTAIGTGNPDSPDDASLVASAIKNQGNFHVLYGGSVNSENVNEFTRQQNIEGVLVGGSSLNPQEFISVIYNA